jgi:hypothetical protein
MNPPRMNTAMGRVDTTLARIKPVRLSSSPSRPKRTYSGTMLAWAGMAMPRTRKPKMAQAINPLSLEMA